MEILFYLCFPFFRGKKLIDLPYTVKGMDVSFSGILSYIEVRSIVVQTLNIYVVVQFYSWFNVYFLLFQKHYHTLPCPQTKKIKFKPRIKLNHNIYSGNWSKTRSVFAVSYHY